MRKWIFVFLVFMGALHAEKFPATILPGISSQFNVRLELPNDTCRGSFDQSPNISRGIILGKQIDLDNHFEGNRPIAGPLISARVSDDASQSGGKIVLGDLMHRQLKSLGSKELCEEPRCWGPFPVLVVKAIDQHRYEYHMVFVGLNDPSCKVLQFTMTSSHLRNIPNQYEWCIWRKFIEESG